MGGAERVLLALSEIYPNAPIYTLTFNSKLSKFFDPNRIHTSYLQPWQWIPPRFFIGLYPRAIESFDFSEFDVVISSSHSFAKNIITKPETKHISYIHSPMRYAWDSAHVHLDSQAHRTPIGSGFGLVQLIAGNIISKLRLWDRLGADRVDLFLANSQNVADRIWKYYRKESIIVYPPVDVEMINATNTHQDYFLIISRLSPYKRIELAVEACQRLGMHLVVIGAGEALDNIRKMATSKTQVLGWVDDAEKFRYLAGARAIIFPGEEDLGIVPIEAMAAGKPVIAYKKGGLLETVIQDKTGVFFDNQTVTDIETAIHHFLAHEHEFDWKTIRNHAEQFSRTVFEDKIRKIVEEYGKR